MALIGPEGAIQELPQAWRRVAYAALFGISLTAGYFLFVAGPIANAKDVASANSGRIDKVESDISTIKSDVSDIKAKSAARDQKIDDMKDSLAAMSAKLDRLISQGQHAAASKYPP